MDGKVLQVSKLKRNQKLLIEEVGYDYEVAFDFTQNPQIRAVCFLNLPMPFCIRVAQSLENWHSGQMVI